MKRITQWVVLFGIVVIAIGQTVHQGFAPRRAFTFTYAVKIYDIPRDANRLDFWVPLPRDTRYQNISDLTIQSPIPYTITEDVKFKNKMAYFHAEGELPRSLTVTVTFNVLRQAAAVLEHPVQVASLSEWERREFLAPDSLVPINDRIYEEIRKSGGAGLPPLERARAFYNYLLKTMQYDKSGQGWGRGDALYACDVRKGNCTDFHSLFIGMARASGIPARFIIGFPLHRNQTEGEIPGYHCWAEFYVEGKGWIPVDISEAYKRPAEKDLLFGGLDADRVAFTIGRDIALNPPVVNHRLNYFIYPYVLVDKKPFYQFEKHFRYRNRDVDEKS